MKTRGPGPGPNRSTQASLYISPEFEPWALVYLLVLKNSERMGMRDQGYLRNSLLDVRTKEADSASGKD